MAAAEVVLLVGHGTRLAAGNERLRQTAARLQAHLGDVPVRHAFLELAQPDLDAGLCEAAAAARRVTLLPVLLLPAGHVRRDIPAAVRRARERFPRVEFVTAAPLGTDAAVQAALLARIARAEARAASPAVLPGRAESLLLVVGRGGSDHRANAAVADLARALAHAAGFAASAVAYCDVPEDAPPPAQAAAGPGRASVAAALRQAAASPARRVVVLPFLLFPGLLLQRLAAQVQAAAAATPQVQWLLADPVGLGPELEPLLLARLAAVRPAAGGSPPAPLPAPLPLPAYQKEGVQ